MLPYRHHQQESSVTELITVVDYIILGIGFVFNVVALIGVVRGKFVLKCYRRFLLSLIASDLLMVALNVASLAGMSAFESVPTSPATHLTTNLQHCTAAVIRDFTLSCVFANLFNLCAMSIDHFIGIAYPLHYRQLMDKPIVRFAVPMIWLVSFFLGFIDGIFTTIAYLYTVTRNKACVSSTEYVDSFIEVLSASGNSGSGSGASYEQGDAAISPSSSSGSGVPSPSSNQHHQQFQDDYTYNNGTSALVESFYTELSNLLTAIESDGFITTSANNKVPLFVSPPTVTEITPFLRQMQTTGANPLVPAGCDLCLSMLSNKLWLEMAAVGAAVVCFFFLAICYGKIFKKVSSHLNQPKKCKSIRKLVTTTILLIGAFALTWLPFSCFEIGVLLFIYLNQQQNSIPVEELMLVHDILRSLFMTCAVIHPVVYVSAVPAVRRYMEQRYRFFGSLLRRCFIITKSQLLFRHNNDVFMAEFELKTLTRNGKNSASNSTIYTQMMTLGPRLSAASSLYTCNYEAPELLAACNVMETTHEATK